ncbi:MAG: hypothetical protein HFH86_00140 [Bacilli bacterium]|nr:hypothetical protein [Bacilli bacterium]
MNREIRYVLKKLNQNGYEAYIVGGYVRDFLRNQKSSDVDICTNALPKDVHKIFKCASKMGEYGSFRFQKKRFQFDITTFRKELKYQNRKPIQIEYVTELLEDLKRRDFTINAICIDYKGNIKDPFHGQEDLKQKMIRSIQKEDILLTEDPLRILRAIRFASILDFEIEETLWESIQKNYKLCKTLSKEKIKKELDKMLLSPNFQKGFHLLAKANLLPLLQIETIPSVYVNDLNGMWAQISTTNDYGRSKNEMHQINTIKKVLNEKEITPIVIYNFGYYASIVAAQIKKVPLSKILKQYKKMPIHNRKELKITFEEIKKITQKNALEVKKIEQQLIEEVLSGNLKNKKNILKNRIQGGIK